MTTEPEKTVASTTPATAGADAPPAEALANLHLDEVTGEKVSKSELKKRIKAREREAEKQKKAAAQAAAKPTPAASAGPAESQLTPNQVGFHTQVMGFLADSTTKADCWWIVL